MLHASPVSEDQLCRLGMLSLDGTQSISCGLRMAAEWLLPWHAPAGWRAHLQTGEADEEDGADSDLIDEVSMPGLDPLAHIIHHMHSHHLHRLGYRA